MASIGPDPFYADHGAAVVNTDPVVAMAIPSDVASLPDGRTYVVYPTPAGFGISRLTIDGAPDPTFGNGGVAIIPSEDTTTQVAGMIIQPDGKVLITGEVRNDFGVARVNPDGTPDVSFGGDGVVNYGVGTFYDATTFGSDYPHELLLQPDGRIVVIGETNNGNKSRGAVLRLNADGTVDATFGKGGRVVKDLSAEPGGIGGTFEAGLVLSDGKLLLGGGSYLNYNRGRSRVMLARYTPDGQLDTTFGTAGLATQPTDYFTFAAMAAAPEGGFYGVLGSIGSAAVSRWTDAGALDPSFGTGGITPFGRGTYRGGDLAVQRDGSIVAAAGYSATDVRSGYAIGGFTADGRPTFYDEVPIDDQGGGGTGVALQPHGKAVVTAGGVRFPSQSFLPTGPLVVRYRSIPDPGKGARLEGGILEVTGDGTDNRAVVSREGNRWVTTVDGQTTEFPAADVRRVEVALFDGEDALDFNDPAESSNIDLGNGNDTVRLWNAHLVLGGNGDDTFDFFGGDASGPGPATEVRGGAGSDTVVARGTPGDDAYRLLSKAVEGPFRGVTYGEEVESVSVFGGEGDDTLTVDTGAPPVGGGPPTNGAAASTFYGGDGNDTFVGINGPAGRDQSFAGGPGDDTFIDPAGRGVFSLAAGEGNDAARVIGGGNSDSFSMVEGLLVGYDFSLTLYDPAALETLEVDGGASGDSFVFSANPPVRDIHVTGGGGPDTLTLGTGGTIGNLTYDAGGDNGDTADLSDLAAAAHTYVVTSDQWTVDNSTILHATGLDRVSLRVGDRGNHVVLGSRAGLSSVTLVGGRGADLLEVPPIATGAGTDAGATITLAGGFGPAADTFRVTPDPRAAFKIFGGPPNNLNPAKPPPYDATDPGDRLEVDFGAAMAPGGAAPRYTTPSRGRGRYEFAGFQPVDLDNIDFVNDLPAPGGPGIGFQTAASPQAVVFTFSEAVDGLAVEDLSLINVSTGATITADKVALAYDAAARTAVFTFPGLPGGLPGGNYRAMLPAGSISGAADAAPMKSDYAIEFSAAPTVEAMYVGSTKWAPSFGAALSSKGLGDAANGFRVNPGDVTRPLPWADLDRVVIRFSGPVVAHFADLVMQGTTGRYGIRSFAYDPATFTATWTLSSPLRNDRIALKLWASIPEGSSLGVYGPKLPGPVSEHLPAGTPLDGDYSGRFPSGDRVPGGDFRLQLTSLPGDVNGDGRVNSIDLWWVRARVGRTHVYNARYDVSGDGRVDLTDFSLVRAGVGRTVPAASTVAASLFASKRILA